MTPKGGSPDTGKAAEAAGTPGASPVEAQKTNPKVEAQKTDPNQFYEECQGFPPALIKSAVTANQSNDVHKDVGKLVRDLAVTFGVNDQTALVALLELIRIGGANAGTPGTTSVVVRCPYQSSDIILNKTTVLQTIPNDGGLPVFRAMAEYLGPTIVRLGIERQAAQPAMDQSGDLAQNINKKLLFAGKPGLTSKEMVGCASYAQRLPELDSLTESDRLSDLLKEDQKSRQAALENRQFLAQITDRMSADTRAAVRASNEARAAARAALEARDQIRAAASRPSAPPAPPAAAKKSGRGGSRG